MTAVAPPRAHTGSAHWFRALTVEERLRSLREEAASGRRRTPTAEERRRASERLARWRNEKPLKGARALADPLRLHRASEREILAILGEPVEAVHRRSAEPEWLRSLGEAFAESGRATERLAQFDMGPGVEFLAALERPIAWAKERLRRRAAAIALESSNVPFDASGVADVLFEPLVPRLSRLVIRPLVVELHSARLTGRLRGDTSEARFESFVASLEDRETCLELLHEYPVLARLALTTLADWVDAGTEFLARLADDWDALRRAFAFPADDAVVTVNVLGDRHRGGRAVLAVAFESGRKLVYKPKPVSAELHFRDLTGWLDERTGLPPSRRLRLLARDGYGWAEFVAPRPCASRDELRRFYRRQGGHVALLYVLAASDFHFENVIASGEHPVLVDFECLFQPVPAGAPETLAGAELSAWEATVQSVLAVGMLPRPDLVGADSDAADVSGLGAVSGQLMPIRLPEWERRGTDEMHEVLRHSPMREMQHAPATSDGGSAVVRDFTEDVVAGFTETYRALWRHRDDLLAPDGPIHAFADDEIRVILRPTLDYGLLLESSLHPHFLRDAVDRDRRFDRLLGAEPSWVEAGIADAERRELWRGDIPLFVTQPHSRDLWAGSGVQVRDFFARSGIDVVEHRLRQLSQADLERQTWIVRTSIASAGLTPETLEYAPSQRQRPSRPPTRDRLLHAALAVGARLGELAIRADGEATWIGIRSRQGAQWRIDPVGPDLYGGLAGICLFLSYLGRCTGDERSMALAREAYGPLGRQIERKLPNLSPGGFDGAGGLIYALVHLGALWDDREPIARATQLLERLPAVLRTHPGTDVIGGAAGCAAALVAVSGSLPPEPLAVALRGCVSRLLDSALELPDGIAWPPPHPSWKPLGGFAHGTAGIAWALLELAAATGDERLRDVAPGAIDYQRSLFVPEAGSWRDLRGIDKAAIGREAPDDPFMSHWCNGAAGVALAWLACARYVRDPGLRDDVAIAVRTTKTSGFGFNHCLCHGDLGNVEVVDRAARAGIPGARRADTAAIASEILASIERRGWLTGYPLGLEAPGLMMGLAGIGYGLLRLAAPDDVPSVLLLEPSTQLPRV